jgi:hypothetical protein
MAILPRFEHDGAPHCPAYYIASDEGEVKLAINASWIDSTSEYAHVQREHFFQPQQHQLEEARQVERQESVQRQQLPASEYQFHPGQQQMRSGASVDADAKQLQIEDLAALYDPPLAVDDSRSDDSWSDNGGWSSQLELRKSDGLSGKPSRAPRRDGIRSRLVLGVKSDQTLTPRDESDIVPVDETLSPEAFLLYRGSNADVIRSDDTVGSQITFWLKSEAH